MNGDLITTAQLNTEISRLQRKIAKLEKSKIINSYTESTANFSEEKFSKAFYYSPDVITISTLNEGRYIEVNDACLQVTGYKRSEIIGHTAHELGMYAFPEDRDIIMDIIRRTGGIRNYEMSFRGKSRETFITLISANKFMIAGEPYLLAVIKDISERKKIVEALRLSEERFSKAFNASPVTMCITTIEEGRFIDVNQSFCSVLGGCYESIVGQTSIGIGFWINPEQREFVVKQVLENGFVSDLEVQFRKMSGELRIGLYSGETIDINGQKCLLSIFSDLTERKQIEIEMSRLDRLNLVGEMAASIAHEIRNPMTTVRGYLQILRDNQDFAKELDLFNLMIEELDRANIIISEFLSLARNQAAELMPKSLNAILSNLFPLLQATASIQSKTIALVTGNMPDLLLDEKEIRQMVLNLVNNGLDSVMAGGRVEIKTFLDQGNAVLAIRDEGKGIDQKVLEKLGTPFFTTKDHGTGLGLAVCYGIASRHSAKIDIKTGPDGTTFFIRFPSNN